MPLSKQRDRSPAALPLLTNSSRRITSPLLPTDHTLHLVRLI
jgi:hypothetical protein